MNIIRHTLIFLTLLLPLLGSAQERSVHLDIEVKSVAGDNLSGQEITLTQTLFQLNYGTLKLDADGKCSLNVYPGGHILEIKRNGFNNISHEFEVAEEPASQSVSVTLTEKTRTPFAITADRSHDVFTGRDDVHLTWNTEQPVFFDDFESYTPFAISFGDWTGIDGDLEAAAPLVGDYPNRGVMQYAQIINPLTVTPTWWYEYEVLRPYAGQQYVGFTRTSSGNTNNDWLISPVITPGTENVLTFMAKAADIYTERFMVYVTTKLDNPTQDDFVRIDLGNYETADYKGWKEYSYDLSDYEGQEIKFAIRYISDTNRFGAFMLMVDDVYVGPVKRQEAGQSKARRVQRRSADNRFEKFEIYLDGTKVATTEEYEYTLEDLAAGNHTIGIRSVYLNAQSEIIPIEVSIDKDIYSKVTFNVSADSKAGVDSQKIGVLNMETAELLSLPVEGGKATVASLPFGTYEIHVEEGTFSPYNKTLKVDSKETTLDIVLTDNILDPYNVTISNDEKGNTILRWNQELIYTESFEDFDDFATGEFGGWLTYDLDQKPVYPIALGSQTNIVSFPGSGDATNPKAIGPMVFNPYKTEPAMMPADPAIGAPTGDKTIIFFSPQMDQADKWLVSPQIEIHDNYMVSIKAKGYSRMYNESIEFWASEEGSHPEDFTILAQVETLGTHNWEEYQVPLTEYAGKTIRLAIRYTAYDSFLAQIDDFTVGPESGEGEVVDYGNILYFEIYLDGDKVAQTETPVYTFTALSEGPHTLGVKAIYKNGASALVEQTINVSGVDSIGTETDTDAPVYYDLQGRRLSDAPASGIYLRVQNGKCFKTIAR